MADDVCGHRRHPANQNLNVFPSKKSLARLRERIRGLTDRLRSCVPIPEVIADMNQVLRGWASYSRPGDPRMAFRSVNRFVADRLYRHLRRRSQRPFRPPEGVPFTAHLQALGLELLQPT